MLGEVIHTASGVYIRCAPDSGVIASEQDLLELLSYCHEAGSDQILLDEAHLHPDFFDLKTGLAGVIFLKLSTYRIRTAIVADLAGIKSERFQEVIYECNKGKEIHFFNQLKDAEGWFSGS